MRQANEGFNRYDRPVELTRHQALPLPQARGARVRSLRGTLWITQEGDREDHLVRDGESFTVERDGVTLVSAAHGASTVLVTRPVPQGSDALANWFAVTRNYLLQPRRSS